MAENKRKRCQNFTFDEKDKLVKLLDSYKNVILNKKTDGTTNQAKNEAWVNLCTRFNSTGTTARSKESLMRVWEKMKTDAKLYKALSRSSHSGTGGGPSCVKTDPILEQVSNLMGRACTGITDVRDSDADQSTEASSLPIDQTQTNKQIGDETMEILVFQNENCNTSNVETIEIKDVGNDNDIAPTLSSPTSSQFLKSTPLWKRRRPILKENNDKAEVVSTLCGGFKDLSSKKAIVEDLKIKLFEEELKFKGDLYQLQLEAAKKDIEIKTEMLKQLKGHTFNFQNVLGIPKNDSANT